MTTGIKMVCMDCGLKVPASPGRYPKACQGCHGSNLRDAARGPARMCIGCGNTMPKYDGAYPKACPQCGVERLVTVEGVTAADLVQCVSEGNLSAEAMVESIVTLYQYHSHNGLQFDEFNGVNDV